MFLGKAITERHDHFDARGAYTGSTVVTPEPLWDDDSREAAYALWSDDRERCPDCGQPREVCGNPDVDYFPHRTICWATAARRVALRRWEVRTKDARPDAAGYLPDDGVTVWVSRHDHAPDDDFLTPSIFQPIEHSEGGD